MLKTKRTLLAAAVILATSGLTACGGSSSSNDDKTPTPAPNAAPTDISLSATQVTENAAAAVIGTLTATDADSGETFSYSVSDDRFEVVDSELKLKADTSLDFEAATEVTVTVTVTDSASNTFAKDFTVTVADEVDTYKFASRFIDGESSVSYGGQVARMVLINELKSFIGGLTAAVEAGDYADKAAVVAALMDFYSYSETRWDNEIADRLLLLTTTPEAKQKSLRDVSSSYKDLYGKIAGQDVTGQHKDWNTALVGWNEQGSATPDGVVRALFDMIGDNAAAHMAGTRPDSSLPVYVTDNGLDLQQLVQKFLLGAVAFSQGTDDYLDASVEGKGLWADNTGADKGTKAYSALEHAFDEGFGYFGAARDYNDYTDTEIAGKVKTVDGELTGREDWNGYHDTDADGMIDLKAEFNFGNSVNAAKRDLGTDGATDFSKKAFDAFLAGRDIITQAGGALTEEQMTALEAQRDIAVKNWEMSIAATVVHYINDVTGDLGKVGTDDFSLTDLAKHWSEMKGFALNFQFNPHTELTAEQFAELHTLMGMQPVFTGDVDAYKADLAKARDILQAAYEFDAEHVANW